MKTLALALSGALVLGSVAVSVPAVAQPARYDHGRHHRGHPVRVCRMEYRHHHRVRVCHTEWRRW